jgi:glycosyltransferase involved in cell wall biosynthesis
LVLKKILIITYYWPPASSPGVYRFVKFCKYLPVYGFHPIILTVKNGSYPSVDESLCKEIDPAVKVYRTKTIEPFAIFNRLTGKKGKSVPVAILPQKSDSPLKKLLFFIRANFFLPDARRGWNKFAIKKAGEIIKQENLNCVITTGPPQSTHLIGLKLKKRYHIKWVADLRDPWSSNYYNEHFPRLKSTEKRDYRLETSVLNNADCVTVVSKGMYDDFVDRSKRIEVIPNGFDHTDIPEKRKNTTTVFLMSYIGNFKQNQDVPAFWEALIALKNELPDFQKYFKLKFTGNINEQTVERIKQLELNDIVEFESHISHQEAVQRMVDCNLLFFVIPQAKHNKPIITGKLFEYVASRTPILSIGPGDGNASKILENQHRDKMLDYTDTSKIKSLVLSYFQSWLNDKQLTIAPKPDLWEYSRKGLTKKLTQILNTL